MKPPCVDCERCFSPFLEYWCQSNRKNKVTGTNIFHKCWWYRRTPFCKFKPKDDEE